MKNVIVDLFDRSGMSIREFATAADLKYSTAHDIVTGKANIENIGAGAFVRIARVFGTTADALISGMERRQMPTDAEQHLLALFRSMDVNGRAALMEQAEFLSARHPLNTEADEAIA